MRGRSNYVLSKGLGSVHCSGLKLQIDRLAFRSEEICGGFRWFASISFQICSDVVRLSNVWIWRITGQQDFFSSLFFVRAELNVNVSLSLRKGDDFKTVHFFLYRLHFALKKKKIIKSHNHYSKKGNSVVILLKECTRNLTPVLSI